MSLVAVVMAACSNAAAKQRDPNTLVVVEANDGQTTNPLYAPGQIDGVLYDGLLFDGLAAIGPGFEPMPDLATGWTASRDGLQWDVTLRHGVRWSDGAPFTARDVVFSYRIMRDPKTAYIGAGSLEPIRDVRATGPYSVRFRLAHIESNFPYAVLADFMLPEHVLGSVPAERQLYTSFGEHPIGTGPYVLRRWQHDSEAVFDRNPSFWRGPAKIAHIDVRIIFNNQSAVDALENGSADLIDYLQYESSLRLSREAPHIKQSQSLSIEVGVFEPNLRRPGLRDLAVRRAMMFGHDRAAIIAGFFNGHALLATSILPQALTRWYDPAVVSYPYDPARARAILDAAGWKIGADGVRSRGRTRLSFDVLVNQGQPILLAQVLAFAADMSAIGIHINARLLDFPSIVERIYSGNYDVTFDVRGVSNPDLTDLFASNQIPPAGGNTVAYVDPVADRLMAAGLRELTYSKQRAVYDRLQARVAQTLPMLWDVNQEALMAFTPRLTFPRDTLTFPFNWNNAYDWTLAP